MTYHNWARQCPTAESAVYRAVPRYRQIIPAGTLIHDPRSTIHDDCSCDSHLGFTAALLRVIRESSLAAAGIQPT